MFGIGVHELLIILGIAVLLFGGAKIPQIARSLGASIVEFKKGASGVDESADTPATKENV